MPDFCAGASNPNSWGTAATRVFILGGAVLGVGVGAGTGLGIRQSKIQSCVVNAVAKNRSRLLAAVNESCRESNPSSKFITIGIVVGVVLGATAAILLKCGAIEFSNCMRSTPEEQPRATV